MSISIGDLKDFFREYGERISETSIDLINGLTAGMSEAGEILRNGYTLNAEQAQRLGKQRLTGVRPRAGGRAFRRVAVWRARGVALVDIEQINCIAAVPEGSELHLEGGRTELHAKPLERLLPLLPGNFVRCHRTWIVNMKAVRALHSTRGSRSWLELKDGRELPVGRSRLHALREQIV